MKKIVDKYALLEVIGAGQYGKVYRAETTDTQELYAIKVTPIEKFRKVGKLNEFTLNEIKALSNINHPNIMKYYDKLMTSNNSYMIYEYCNGGTLEDEIYKDRHLTEIESIKFFGNLIEAFKILNEKNIMHRDLKPSNILLHNGVIKLGDFGFCKPLNYKNEMSKTMVGSPIYMAPEILKGNCYDISADIWSLGVVFYEMLFGKCPFEEKTIPRLIRLLETSSLVIERHINNISVESENILKKILVTNPARRITFNDLSNLYETTLKPKLFQNNISNIQSNTYISEIQYNFQKKNVKDNNETKVTNLSRSPIRRIFDKENPKKIARKISTSPIKINDNNSRINIERSKSKANEKTIVKKVYKKDFPSYLTKFINNNKNKDYIQELETIYNKYQNKPKSINYVLEILEDRTKATLLTKFCEICSNNYFFDKDNYYIFYMMLMKKVRNSYLDIKIKITSIQNKINGDILKDKNLFKDILISEIENFNEIFLKIIDKIEIYSKENDVDYTLKLILQKPFEFDLYYYKNSIKEILNKIDNNNKTRESIFLKTILLDCLLIDEYVIYFFKNHLNYLDNNYFKILEKMTDEELINYNEEKLNYVKINYLI